MQIDRERSNGCVVVAVQGIGLVEINELLVAARLKDNKFVENNLSAAAVTITIRWGDRRGLQGRKRQFISVRVVWRSSRMLYKADMPLIVVRVRQIHEQGWRTV